MFVCQQKKKIQPKSFKEKSWEIRQFPESEKMKSTDQDEDYLISRAKRNGLSDENGAENVKALSKSWLITARVMYPGQITRF